jgi:glutamine synthetase
MTSPIRDFLEIPYDELETLNLAAKQQRLDRVSIDTIRDERIAYLTKEKRIKAVTVCFSDLEGRLHMLDYDKKFLLKSVDNLTFDGSSIRGFSQQHESDLRLAIDWAAFYWLPSDVFGPGKVLVFGEVLGREGDVYPADMRARLKQFAADLYATEGLTLNAANEIEGFLFQGLNAEQKFAEEGIPMEFVTTGGYYYSLPGDLLRKFIDATAEVQRAMGFANEKDHPEVAPSQFEINYGYTEVSIAADQVQLYKLICRQVAQNMGMTASFLPKPITGINGSGMHTNLSVSKGKTNIFHDAKGKEGISELGWTFVDRVLANALDICLLLNPSVNSYRRLDPHFEAPNQIKASAIDRGSMVRIPIGNEKSARVEVRSIAPDANPYLVLYSVFKTGLQAPTPEAVDQSAILPDNIFDAIHHFHHSSYASELLGADVHEKYVNVKLMSADRCARKLGSLIKTAEFQFHHEVTNQYLWNKF